MFDSARVTIPPQVHVIATMLMLLAMAVIVLTTVAGFRRNTNTRVSGDGSDQNGASTWPDSTYTLLTWL